MKNRLTLYEKVATTKAGKWSLFLRDFQYRFGGLKMDDEDSKRLLLCADYLEMLAIEELKNEIPQWPNEIEGRMEKLRQRLLERVKP